MSLWGAERQTLTDKILFLLHHPFVVSCRNRITSRSYVAAISDGSRFRQFSNDEFFHEKSFCLITTIWSLSLRVMMSQGDRSCISGGAGGLKDDQPKDDWPAYAGTANETPFFLLSLIGDDHGEGERLITLARWQASEGSHWIPASNRSAKVLTFSRSD